MTNRNVVTLPDIGEGVVEGEIVEWLKDVGDAVSKDEPVVVVMTDKATVELPSPYAGTLARQYYKTGEMAIKDKPLYEIETEAPPQKIVPIKEQEYAVNKRPSEKLTALGDTPQAIPRVKQLAKDLGVDLHLITPSGKDGRITESDIVAYHATTGKRSREGRAHPDILSSTPVLHLEGDEEVPVQGLRNIIAEKMVESKYIIPHFSYFDQLDASRLVKLRENFKKEGEKEGIKVTYMPFIIKALSNTLKTYKTANSSFNLDTRKLVIHHHHHIGIATTTEQGLVVCVLKDVQEMSLNDVVKKYDALMKKAKNGELTRDEMVGSTITISNFGPLGGLWATPIINYPEVAILGVAKIRKEPVVENDAVVVRDILNLSWSFDHRVIDGEAAAHISNLLIKTLKNPAQLL